MAEIMSPISLRRWSAVHRWSSLICSLFLLVICITGLPLIFSNDIDQWIHPHVYADAAIKQVPLDVDSMVSTSRARFPGERIVSVFLDDQEPQVNVWLQAPADARTHKSGLRHYLRFDARTGVALDDVQPLGKRRWQAMNILLGLHRNLLAGLMGDLFLAVMGIVFVVAVVSGVVLYQPFTKHLTFGTVRAARARRIKWLDLHNLLGVSTLVWMLVVGATGAINELATPLFALWIRSDVATLLTRLNAGTPDVLKVPQTALSSVQSAIDTATRAVPGMKIAEITFPARGEGSPWHYVAWAKGDTPLTSRLFNPVLIDARSGKLAAVVQMPWYLRALEISRPLHYGDYGGLPLKIIWAVLDLVTIVVLMSGMYLWIARRKFGKPQPIRQVSTEAIEGKQR